MTIEKSIYEKILQTMVQIYAYYSKRWQVDHINLAVHVNCIKVVLQKSEKIIKFYSKVKFVLLASWFYFEEDEFLIFYVIMII